MRDVAWGLASAVQRFLSEFEITVDAHRYLFY